MDHKFKEVIRDILDNGLEIESRNAKTKRLRNCVMRFTSTPLISVRRTAWKSALREMEWFLSGSNNIEDLHPSVRKWWEPWIDGKNEVNNNYSVQFRDFKGNGSGINQISYLIDEINNRPTSRRQVITTWNTCDMASPATPITNCHGSLIQTFVDPDGTLNLSMHQRSADMMLGVPHNLIQYWAFLHYIAHKTGKKVGEFVWIGGDCHIYDKHFDMAERICENSDEIETPELIYTPESENFVANDFSLSGEYKPIIQENLELIV
jgi:thymidylate synthase